MKTGFVRDNARWLAGGVLLTFCSSVGQTFFIASFAGEIRTAFSLSHGEFGLIYMLATLASAVTLLAAGSWLDRVTIRTLLCLLFPAAAFAALFMSMADALWQLVIAIYLLRFLGQGMMTQTAMVAMGRWFVAGRGKAVSITSLGHQLGEGLLPLPVVWLIMTLDWQWAWRIFAVVLLIAALPLGLRLLGEPRIPTGQEARVELDGRQWTRAEVLRHPPFWLIGCAVLSPAFIGTTVFFHQVHLAESKTWPQALIAGSFLVMSVTTVLVTLISGLLIDRWSAKRLLPWFLLPLGSGCLVLAAGTSYLTMPLFMLLLGCSYGISSAVFGALWPELYGVRHLGAIRAVVMAAMVFATALGPGITGLWIDRGVMLSEQLWIMGFWCFLLAVFLLLLVSRIGDTRVPLPAGIATFRVPTD